MGDGTLFVSVPEGPGIDDRIIPPAHFLSLPTDIYFTFTEFAKGLTYL